MLSVLDSCLNVFEANTDWANEASNALWVSVPRDVELAFEAAKKKVAYNDVKTFSTHEGLPM